MWKNISAAICLMLYSALSLAGCREWLPLQIQEKTSRLKQKESSPDAFWRTCEVRSKAYVLPAAKRVRVLNLAPEGLGERLQAGQWIQHIESIAQRSVAQNIHTLRFYALSHYYVTPQYHDLMRPGSIARTEEEDSQTFHQARYDAHPFSWSALIKEQLQSMPGFSHAQVPLLLHRFTLTQDKPLMRWFSAAGLPG